MKPEVYGECVCGKPRYSKKDRRCRGCCSLDNIRRQERLKAAGVNPYKRLNEDAPHPQYPKAVEAYVCNHCAVRLEGPKALVAHKRTHNSVICDDVQYSLLPSCAAWTGA